MKKALIFSIILNLIFISFFGYLIHRKGGVYYVKWKLGLESILPDQAIGSYWYQKKTMFEIMPNIPNEIVFLGNSITDNCEWSELFNNPLVINRGIGGDITEGVLLRLSEVTESNPEKIFLMIGINDLLAEMNTKDICTYYRLILERIKTESPDAKLYIQSVLPVTDPIQLKNDTIVVLNQKLKNISDEKSLTYINLFDSFIDEKGFLKKDFTNDGLHLTRKAYLIWKSLIDEFVNN